MKCPQVVDASLFDRDVRCGGQLEASGDGPDLTLRCPKCHACYSLGSKPIDRSLFLDGI